MFVWCFFLYDFAHELFMELPRSADAFVGLRCPAIPVASREEAAVRGMSVKRVLG